MFHLKLKIIVTLYTILMPSIHMNVTYTKYKESTDSNWETLTPREEFDKQRKYKKNAVIPPGAHFEGLTIWEKGGTYPFRVHLEPGNDLTYSALKNRDEIRLDGENVHSYSHDSSES